MPKLDLDQYFLRFTFEMAWKSASEGMDPFAAILTKAGKLVATSADKCISYSDPTAHAELVVISEFCRHEKRISLEDYTLYANVEPCIMCSGAIHWARLGRLVFGLEQSGLQKVSGGQLKPSADALINLGKERTQVFGPFLEEEALKVFEAFPFQSKKERHRKFHSSK
jgi:tRNA(Arg) A34 adenosine deaminase TadA